jgi:hypothetical protein
MGAKVGQMSDFGVLSPPTLRERSLEAAFVGVRLSQLRAPVKLTQRRIHCAIARAAANK